MSCKKDSEKESTFPKKAVPKPVFKYGYNLDHFKVTQDTIESGESFGIILDRHHIFSPKINKIASTIKETFDVRKVRAGKLYTVLASKDSAEKAQVFIYNHDKINATVIDFKDSIITATRYQKPIKTVLKTVQGVIKSSLSVTLDSLHLSPNLNCTIADSYAWTLDFYKLQKGDSFKFLYEEKFIDDTIFAGYGEVKSSVFKHKGQNLYAFRYTADSILGIPEYYDDKGNMLRSQFLKSPIKFQYRISSRYNLRRKIAYYGNKVRHHRGTDFAAPKGTPIMASGNGVIKKAGWCGGGGNCVKIRHNSTYETVYAHMSKFARGIKNGVRVKQGQTIGYVGSTGKSTGPHLHYEVIVNGKKVNSQTLKLPSGKILKGKDRQMFETNKIKLDVLKSEKIIGLN